MKITTPVQLANKILNSYANDMFDDTRSYVSLLRKYIRDYSLTICGGVRAQVVILDAYDEIDVQVDNAVMMVPIVIQDADVVSSKFDYLVFNIPASGNNVRIYYRDFTDDCVWNHAVVPTLTQSFAYMRGQ